MLATRLSFIAALLSTLPAASAHGGSHAPQKPLSLDNIDDWATLHMASEHRIANFDPSSFFKLHDFDSDGHWEASEIQRTYGLEDKSNKDVPEQKRQEVVSQVLELYDFNRDGFVTMLEWMTGIGSGKRLPDMGVSLVEISGACRRLILLIFRLDLDIMEMTSTSMSFIIGICK